MRSNTRTENQNTEIHTRNYRPTYLQHEWLRSSLVKPHNYIKRIVQKISLLDTIGENENKQFGNAEVILKYM